jgi:hypothetical protein
MENNSFILLSRSILDSEVFASQKMLKIWIWCLCKANFKDKNVPLKVGRGERVVKVKRGEFIFGRFRAEEDLFIDGSTIYKILQKLQKIGNISIKSNNQYSIITICNYDHYQSTNTYKVTTKEQPSTNQVTTKEQPSNTTKKDNKDKKEKNKYSEFVFLKETEYNNLIKKYGEQNAIKCIETLNNYKGANGKTYKSDYLAILNWVVGRLELKEIGKSKLCY